jgi:hypothetical protein
MANCFWKKRVKDKVFEGEGRGAMGGTQGGGGGGVISLVRKRNNKLKSKQEKLE